MLLTAASAKALAAIALCSMLGSKEYRARLPLLVESSGPYWFVRGQTSRLGPSKTFLDGFHVCIDKTTAEMRDLATMDANVEKPSKTRRVLRRSGWRPPKRGGLGQPLTSAPSALPPDLVMFLYHGVLGTPEAAINYARVLMRASPRLKSAAGRELQAEAHNDVWQVTMTEPGGVAPRQVLSISQINGKVVSGDL